MGQPSGKAVGTWGRMGVRIIYYLISILSKSK